MDNSYIICFYGSSDYELDKSLAVLYNLEIEKIIDSVLRIKSNNLKIITGGYGGIMDSIAGKIQKKKSSHKEKTIEVIGISCDGYDFENPYAENYNASNDYSKNNDVIIQAENFADRIQTMIELSDLFIVLPGKQGSLNELLLTYDSYAFGEYILNNKKTKLFIHDYWKPLLNNEIINTKTGITYFRKFNSNILQYFNCNDIDSQLTSLYVQNVKVSDIKKNPNHQLSDGKETSERKFQLLKENINKTILGRLYDRLEHLYTDGKTVADLLGIKKETPILGLDFGWFMTSNAKPKSGNYSTFSTNKYVNLTKVFFSKHNSIMLNNNEFNNEFKKEFLNGKYQTQTNISFREEEFIPKIDDAKAKGTFDDLKKHFEDHQYGQTLIWKGFKVALDSSTKKNTEENANEIIFSVFLLLNHIIPTRKEEKIRHHINDFLLSVSATKSAELFQEKEKEIINQAVRAAISQVMARNMSHNIGSHVLSKFKDEKEICDVCVVGNKDTQFNGEANFYSGSDYLQKGSHLIAYFNEYLKNRMDFLADIATTDPVMETPMYLFRDILKGFDKNRILLNRISGVSSNIKFSIKVLNNKNEINTLNHSNDPLLSIPNEILGAQAFYILLENIIRNIYKHGNPTEDIEIKIKVKDYEKDASFYEIAIYDNIAKDKIDDIVTNRNKSFNNSILEYNKLRPNNLGTIEMDVCAVYLRCLPIISIENSEFDLQEDNQTDIPRLIYAYKHQLCDTEFSLGYKLCISKPKEILVVTNSDDKFNIEDCKHEKDLAKAGIKVIDKEELEKSEAIYNHQILCSLVSSDDLNTILVKKQAMLPIRIVHSTRHVSLKSSEKFIESVWEQYTLKFSNESSKCYCIKNGESSKKHINFTLNGIELLSECNTTDCHTTYIDNHNQEWAKKDNWNYYDMACSHSKINKLKDAILWDDNKRLAAEYIEVIKTKVVLLDERIQQNISNENRKYTANGIETPLTEYFEKQKLFIAKKSDCDLNEVSFGRLAESDCENGETVSSAIFRYIKSHLSGIEKPDFVIIHLGILEKMLPSSEDKKQDDIKDLINRLFTEERKRLVVTSGRGKPNNLPEDIPFLPLALVQNAVETLFDKFLLTKILFNSRKSV